MITARPKFRFAPTRIENDPYLGVAVGYLLLSALLCAAGFAIGTVFALLGELHAASEIARLASYALFAAGYYWTAREVEALHKTGGYVLVGLVVLGALPIVFGDAHLLTVVMTALSILVLVKIWPHLE